VEVWRQNLEGRRFLVGVQLLVAHGPVELLEGPVAAPEAAGAHCEHFLTDRGPRLNEAGQVMRVGRQGPADFGHAAREPERRATEPCALLDHPEPSSPHFDQASLVVEVKTSIFNRARTSILAISLRFFARRPSNEKKRRRPVFFRNGPDRCPTTKARWRTCDPGRRV
jgi:hypothetical protein